MPEELCGEIMFNPDSLCIGKKILWMINNGYDVIVEKTDNMEATLRPTKRVHRIKGDAT